MKKEKKIMEDKVEELKSIWMDPLNPSIYFESIREQEEKVQKEYEEEMKEEEIRLTNLPCPLCKSLDKHLHIDYSSNGIYGPGSSSRIINEYYICNECGILFKDLKKKDIQRPSKLFNF